MLSAASDGLDAPAFLLNRVPRASMACGLSSFPRELCTSLPPPLTLSLRDPHNRSLRTAPTVPWTWMSSLNMSHRATQLSLSASSRVALVPTRTGPAEWPRLRSSELQGQLIVEVGAGDVFPVDGARIDEIPIGHRPRPGAITLL